VATRAASTLTIVAIFLLGASLHGKGEVTVGNIVTFSGFAMTLIGRLEQFAGFISALFFQTPSLRDFFSVLDTPSALKESPDTPRLPVVSGEVVFEDVAFGYSAAHTARLEFPRASRQHHGPGRADGRRQDHGLEPSV
jgi:ABC-type multidrug transport system fused ATPase/permease subunit